MPGFHGPGIRRIFLFQMPLIPWSETFTAEQIVEQLDVRSLLTEARVQGKSAYALLKEAGYPVFKFVSDGPVAADLPAGFAGAESKAATLENEPSIVTLVASTNATDLVGDVMEQTALQQMKTAAPGTTVFLNHSYNLPEDVFGTVISADIVTKKLTNPVSREAQDYLCLIYKVSPVSKEENPRGFQTYMMLAKGKRRLGASVTVLILEKSENTDGKRSIKQVFYIETSMVGVPCNQLSWAQYAANAVALGATTKAVSVEDAVNVNAQADKVTSPSAELGVKAMPNQAASSQPETKTAAVAVETPEVVQKAAYADARKQKTQRFWFMVDTLNDAICKLKAAHRDKQQIDYAAALAETLGEFNADVTAAVLPILTAPIVDNGPSYDYGYYSLFNPADGQITLDNVVTKMLNGMSEETKALDLIQKAGARNSKADTDRIQKMHDHCCDLGAKCAEKSADDSATDDSSKGISEAGTGVEATGEMVSKSVLDEKKTELANLKARVAELETANKSLSEESTKWELAAHATAAKAREMAEQPLPRIGQ
ncbi:MAG: hypothetical protein ABI977_22105, partial [Acidobacteriota bacterium]